MKLSGRVRAPVRTTQRVFTVLVIVFIGRYLATIDWSELRGLRLAPGPFVLATVISLAYRFWGAHIWLFLLRQLGADLGRAESWQLLYVYAKSWMGRYLLGAGTWIAGKVFFATQHGIPRRNKLAVSGVLEAALQMLATLAVGLSFLVADSRLGAQGSSAATWSSFALVFCIIALIPSVFRLEVRAAYWIFRRRPIDPSHLPGWRPIVRGAGLYVVGTLMSGVSYFFVAQAVYGGLDSADLLYVVGASSVAAAVSLVVVIAPAGLGVREGIQVMFLTAIMPQEVAWVIAIFTRVWSIGLDAIFVGLAFFGRRYGRLGDRGARQT